MSARFKIHRVVIVFVALCSVAVFGLISHAQDGELRRWENGVSEAWWISEELASNDEAAAVQAKWKLIKEENKRAAISEWAGDYFIGSETHGSYFRWSAQNGFVLVHVNKCAAQVMGFSYGQVSASPAFVRLIPERTFRQETSHQHGGQQTENNFIPVKFRGDRLLVPESEMADFGDYTVGLGKFNESAFIYYFFTSHFFYKEGGEEIKEATDVAIVPAGYERFLKQPIKGKITGVGKRIVRRDYTYESPTGQTETYTFASITPIVVDIGASDGAKRGLILKAVNTSEEVKITNVGETSSTAILIRSLDERGRETYFDHDSEREKVYPRIAVGWKLTTSPF
jgi:hypothetical protein